MTWQQITYFISIIIAAVVMGFIAWYSWKRRASVAGAGVYMWIAFLVSLVSIFQGMSMIGISAEWALFWFNLRILCFAAIPVLWLIFVIHFIGKTELLSKAQIAMLFIIPVITQLILWTNDMHGWWVVRDVGFRHSGLFFIPNTAVRIPGRWYIVHNLYTYGMMLAGLIILFISSFRMKRQYRGQVIALGAGTLVMIIGALFPSFNLVPGLELNPMPQSFALGSLIIAWSLYRHRFLDSPPVFDEEKLIPRMHVMLLVIVTGGILALGVFYYRHYENQYRAEVESRLLTISELKVGEIAQWRKERISDASILHGNTAFTILARRFFSDSTDIDAYRQIRNWLEKIQSFYQYDHIVLLDAQENPRLSVPQSAEPVCNQLKQQAGKIMREGRIAFLDLHREALEKPIYLTVTIPIIENGRPLGLVAMFIDPAVYLYPLINRWPTQSRTAETLLVRRDGNDALYLNELKFRENAALNLRVHLTEEKTPAVMAVLGRVGVVEGIDYRGTQVMASIRGIPDSPWFIVARMDLTEVYEPLKQWLWLIILLMCALISVAWAGVWLLWRRQGDRTNREKVEAADRLLESEARFQRVISATRDGIWEWDIQTNREYFAPRWFEIIGYSPDDPEFPHTFDSWASRIHPDDRDRVMEVVKSHLDSGTEYNVDYRHRHKSGEYRWQNSMGARMLDENGKVIKMVGRIIDITDRKRAEIAIKMSKNYLDNIINFTGDPIFVKDDNFRFTLVNNALCDMLGIDRKDIIGKTLGESLPEDQINHFQKVDKMIFESGVENQCEEFVTGQNGKILTVITKKTLFVDELGNRFIIGVIHDITDRKHAEEEILKKNEDLLVANTLLEEAIQNQERSRLALLSILEDEKLSKNALQESEISLKELYENLEQIVVQRTSELEKANKELESFTYSVSHDLRAPLRHIDGFLEMLKREMGDISSEKVNHYMEVISKSSKQMAQLIDDLLSFSRMSRKLLSNQHVNMDSLADEVLNEFSQEIDMAKISISRKEMPEVKGDGAMLRVVLVNLISNAIKFSNKTVNPEIEIGCKKIDNEDTFYVRDNGVGFDMRYVDKLFGVFQRLHNDRDFIGTGIGLAMVKNIIERHNGSIRAEGEPGKGACFYFNLPAT